MAADVQKTVEIVLKVTGADPKQIDGVLKSFTTLNVGIKTATASIREFSTALKAIKAPANLNKLTQSLTTLSTIKAPNLLNVANGLEKIINTPLSGFAAKISTLQLNLKRLSDIKLPNLGQIGTGLAKIINTPLSAFGAKVTVLETGLKRLAKIDLANVATVLRRIAAAKLEGATKEVKGLEKSLEDAGIKARVAGFQIRSFGDKVKTVLQFRLISGAILAVNDAVRSGITAIIEYDQALKNLQAITSATNIEVAQMGATILEVASRTKFSASEIAAGMVVIAQAGFSASEAVQTMQSVSDLATGTLSSMATSVDLVTTAMRVFGIEASQSAMVADVFANAVNRSKLTIDKLRVSMNFVGPIAKDAGVTFQELSAAMGTLANSGIRASTIGTGLRRVFAQLVAPSKKLQDAARAAGVTLNELNPAAVGLQTVMQNLDLVISDTGIAFDIFGKRGASAALALTANSGAYGEMLATISRQGTAAKQAAKQMEGLGVSYKNLSDKIGLLAIAFGKSGLSAALKLIVDAARVLVDVLTEVVDSALGRFVVYMGIVTGSIYVAITAFNLLSKSLWAFKTAQAAAAAATLAANVALKGGTVAATAFQVALGPVYWLLVAIAAIAGYALFKGMSDSAKEASDSAAILAEEYTVLIKKMKDHEVAVVNMAEGSEELKKANIGLRDQLLEVADGSSEVAKEAKEAANSIDPFNGKIKKGEKALKAYAQALNKINATKLSTALNEAGKSLDFQTNKVHKWTNRWKDAFGQVAIYGKAWGRSIKDIMDFDYAKVPGEWAKAWKDASARGKEIQTGKDLADSIRLGEIALEDLKEEIAGFNTKNLTSQQQAILDSFEAIENSAEKYITFLRASEQIDLDNSTEDLKTIADVAGITGLRLEVLLAKFNELKEIAGKTFDNLLDKWQFEDDPQFLTKTIAAYEKAGGLIKENELAEIKAIENVRMERVKSAQDLDKELALAKKNNTDTEEWRIIHFAKMVALEIKAKQDIKALSNNEIAQKLLLYEQEQEALKQHLKKIAVQYKTQEDKLSLMTARAIAQSKKRTDAIMSGSLGDPKEQTRLYKEALDERETAHAKYIAETIKKEVDGEISAETAIIRKAAASLDFYKISMEESEKLLKQVSKENNPTEYAKRLKKKEDDTKRYYEELSKYRKAYYDVGKELELTELKISSEARKADFKRSIDQRKNETKIAISNLKSLHDQEMISNKVFFAAKKEAINRDAKNQTALFNVRIKQIKKEYADKIEGADSEKAALLLVGEEAEKLKEIQEELDAVEQRRIITVNDLTSAEYKAAEAARKRTEAIVKQLQKTVDSSGISNTKRTHDLKTSQKIELDAIKRYTKAVIKEIEKKDPQNFIGLAKAKSLEKQAIDNLELKHYQQNIAEKVRLQDEAYETEKNRRDSALVSTLLSIKKEGELTGKTTEEVSRLQLDAELKFRAESLRLAKEYRAEINKTDSPDDYISRNNEVLKAEKEFNEERLKSYEGYASIKQDLINATFDKETKTSTAWYKNQTKVQKETYKTLNAELEAALDMRLITLTEFYDKKRILLEEDIALQKTNLQNRGIEVKDEYDRKIDKEPSAEGKIDLEAEKTAKLIALQTELQVLHLNGRKLRADLAADKDADIADAQDRVDDVLEEIKRAKDASEADLYTTTYDRQFELEIDTLKRANAEKITEMIANNASIAELQQAAADFETELANRITQYKKEQQDLQMQNAAQTAGNLASIAFDLYNAGIIQSEKAFKAYQAFAIVEATISAYASAQAAYENMTKAGGPMGTVMGAIAFAAALAKGLATVAAISSQQPPSGYAGGGSIQGYSPTPTSDNIDIRATSGEFMQPVSAVRKYGTRVMEAIRTLKIPKESLQNLLSGGMGLNIPIPSYALASGGSVPVAKSSANTGASSNFLKDITKAISKQKQPINIMNVTDPKEITHYLATSEGANSILNVLSSNSQRVRGILR